MLFVNRRGFAVFTMQRLRLGVTLLTVLDDDDASCRVRGPGSDVGRRTSNPGPGRYMQCHACSQREPVPTQCPTCKSMRLHQYGVGTQKVEEELKNLFPFAKVARLDRDIASQRRAHEQIYRSFVSGELDILVGTQMIAKGFDFPNVTLVGVVDADVSCIFPIFARLNERLIFSPRWPAAPAAAIPKAKSSCRRIIPTITHCRPRKSTIISASMSRRSPIASVCVIRRFAGW